MPESLLKKAKYGLLIDIGEYTQIPILQYTPKNIINENPYIRLEDIHREYELVKGRAEEIDFWEKVKFNFEQGKARGYKSEKVYPINEEQAIVEADKSHATLYFWDPDATLDDDEEEWLWDNAEEYNLFIDGNQTHFYIYSCRKTNLAFLNLTIGNHNSN